MVETSLEASGKVLYAFDFDHTVLDGNSDTEVTRVAIVPVPQSVKDVYDGTNWTHFMNHVFHFLHSQGTTIDQLKQFVKGMTPTPGMVTLLQEIHRRRSPTAQLLIISDANDIFISTFLESIGVEADAVITNLATVTDTGKLELSPYEDQDGCGICPRNLCKGTALSNYMRDVAQEHGHCTQVIYVGDGHNDICPAMRLKEQDFLFPRKGYSLENILKKGIVKGKHVESIVDVKAQVCVWDHADTIRDRLFPISLTDTNDNVS